MKHFFTSLYLLLFITVPNMNLRNTTKIERIYISFRNDIPFSFKLLSCGVEITKLFVSFSYVLSEYSFLDSFFILEN
jgi:hypothetical protein